MTKLLNLLPGAEPFFFRGSATHGHIGCLVLHGFTGVPGDVRSLGEHLARQGYTVYGPRLTHHGTDPSDLNRSEWHDWYLAALDGWYLLQGQCEQVVVMGLSMGGSTALLLAARHPTVAVISMSSPIYLYPDWRLPFARYIWHVYPFARKRSRPHLQEASEQYARESYEVNPIRGVAEVREYLSVVEESLADVKVPALLVHSRHDETVPPGNMEYIYQRLGSAHKEQVWLEQNAHVITESAQKQRLFTLITQFMAIHTQPKPTSPPPDANWLTRWWQQLLRKSNRVENGALGNVPVETITVK